MNLFSKKPGSAARMAALDATRRSLLEQPRPLPEDDDIPVGHILTRKEVLLMVGGAGLTFLTGCGGSGGASSSSSAVRSQATVTITWPSTTSSSVSSRLIPTAANSITIVFAQNGTTVATQTVSRPSSGTTTTASFTGLPVGSLTVTATAYPTSTGTGTAQATATTTVTIVSGQTTAVSITMASTIDHLSVTPTAPSVTVGSTTQLAAAAVDSSGNIVLTSSSTIGWSSATTSVATVSSSGLVSGIAAGTAVITAKDSESGKSGSVTVTVNATSVSCVAFPQLTEGPYWVDEELDRSDIRSDPSSGTTQSGVLLTLSLSLVNVNGGCSVISGAQIDIWHCNALGIYSDESVESTSGQKFLRGYQTTDSLGQVTFVTIYPGWYSGRTTHIHVRVRFTSGGKSYNLTTQLFFADTLTSSIYSSQSPYSTKGQKDTSNSTDSIYESQTQLTLAGSASAGYTASFVLGVSV